MPPEEHNQDLKGQIAYIGGIAGSMLAIFALLEALTGSSLGSPVLAFIVGVLITVGLIRTERIQLETALVTLVIVALTIFIVFYFVSQPATVSGSIVDGNGNPIQGITITLTDADGVDH